MILRTKVCIKCGREKPIERFGDPITMVNGRQLCGACDGSRKYDRLRLEFLSAFGGKCSCCGESHPYFLTLEHVKPQNYKKNKVKTSRALEMRKAKSEGWDRTKWDCLCISCNFAKGLYGECPHRSGVTKEQVVEAWKKNASFKVKRIMPRGWSMPEWRTPSSGGVEEKEFVQ